jgi:NAD(P)-dependent dehydrogenase (short-subunit alcohol dehydrogenase family)
MAGRVAGKVALITGAGRGQGRSHAIRLAEEGADIIALDVPRAYTSVGYGMASEADLAETAQFVEKLGQRVVTIEADVRDLDGMRTAVDQAVAELGRLDVVSANAAICTMQTWDEVTPEIWQ